MHLEQKESYILGPQKLLTQITENNRAFAHSHSSLVMEMVVETFQTLLLIIFPASWCPGSCCFVQLLCCILCLYI